MLMVIWVYQQYIGKHHTLSYIIKYIYTIMHIHIYAYIIEYIYIYTYLYSNVYIQSPTELWKNKKRFNLQAPPVYDRKVTNLFFFP